MKFFKNKDWFHAAAGDRLAKAIADQVIYWQRLFALKLNAWINGYSKQRQKRMLWIFCSVFAGGMVCSLFATMRPVKNAAAPYPVHIGMASHLPSKPAHLKRADTLTTKHK